MQLYIEDNIFHEYLTKKSRYPIILTRLQTSVRILKIDMHIFIQWESINGMSNVCHSNFIVYNISSLFIFGGLMGL